MKHLTTVITLICSALFFMVGSDKFLNFMEPPCTLQESIDPMIWKAMGVIMMAAGALIWLPKFRRPLSIFFCLYMLTFITIHLVNGQSDIGGAASMAVLLGILAWNPKFLRTSEV